MSCPAAPTEAHEAINADRLPDFLPAERFSALLRDYEARGGTLTEVAARSGITDRALRQIRNGRVGVVRFSTADRIVIALDPWLWHRPPPEGLGDLYGSPLVPSTSTSLAPTGDFRDDPGSDREPRRRSNVPGRDTGKRGSDVRAA